MERQPLLLIPGLACDADVWRHQVEHLSDIAEPILIPNLANADTPQKMLEAVLNGVPQKFNLAGHSMGGWVALEVMKQAGERVNKLCLLSTTAEMDTDEKKQSRLKLIELVEQGKYEEVVANLLDLFVYRPELREPVKAMLTRNEAAFVHQQRALMQRESSLQILGKISQPTLLILGRQDIDFPAETQAIAAAISNAKLAWIENCGHMSPMEQPEAVTALMRYWLEHME